MSDAREITVTVDAAGAGARLDKWLADNAENLSRTRIQALIEDGRVSAPDGIADNISRKVREGETYVLTVPPPTPAKPEAEEISLDVLYEDADLIVIHKPAGLVVHPAPGHASSTLVNALLHHCRGSLSGIGGVTRPGIVHRLDKDTSGVMVCAKSDIAHRGLVEQFQVHSIDRAYFAVVWGVPSPRQGRLEGNIGRDPKNRKRMATVTSGGKHAVTDYRVIRPIGAVAALMDCHLFTGRTHQIRVQMSGIGHPLVGDPLYHTRGSLRKDREIVIRGQAGAYKHQALHAYKLGFKHPVTREEMRFEIELSNEIKELIDSLEQI
ncbi:MAG: RluA family pseudouridine synthase [Rhodospirillales bacterium]|nr:RluA family pseudouridine synthase [Rhodospirillales bacterium]MBO6785787.1 RluA family pseudouridine synthase [Rhodospirillales bacterium]